MILRETLILAALGITFGVLVAAGLTRYLESLLLGLKSSDPVTFSGAVLVMLVVAVLAGWWHARGASRLDPRSLSATNSA